MATVYGVNRTILNSGTPDHTLAKGLSGGRVRAMIDTYEANALAANSVVLMGGKLPVGANIVDVILDHDALGGGTSIDVGDAADADRYIDGEDTSSAGTARAGNGEAAEDATAYVIATTDAADISDAANSDRQVQMTILGGSATGSIRLVTLYTID